MAKSIKKLGSFFLDKKHLALFLLFVVLTVLVPLKFAQAGLAELFAEGITKILTASAVFLVWPVIGFLLAAEFVTGALTAFASLLLWIMMKATMEGIPLIPVAGGDNVVDIGWAFTRDLANMAFVIILAWVAFATILRIRSYEVRTFLPKLLIIALLINFIPVIAGIIIDISDILTKFFIGESIGVIDQWLSKFSLVRWGTAIVNEAKTGDWWGTISKITDAPYAFLVLPIGGVLLNLISGFVFLIYALIFIVRVVAIWILIILAPLAWLGYIIPAGKRWWGMWWNQFILWSIIGIPMSFFLYLSGQALGKGFVSCDLSQISGNWLTVFVSAPSAKLFCNFLPYIAGVVILIFGLGISFSLTPRGASGIIDWSKKTVKATGKFVGLTAGVAAGTYLGKKYGGRVKEWAEQRGLGIAERKKEAGVIGKGLWGMAGLATSGLGLGAAKVEGWVAKQEKAKAEKAKAKTKGQPLAEQLAQLATALKKAKAKMPGAVEEVIGRMEAMREDENLEDAFERKIITDEEYGKYADEAKKRGRKALSRFKPSISVEDTETWQEGNRLEKAGNVDTGKKMKEQALDEMLAKIKPADIALMSESEFAKESIKKSVANVSSGEQMAAVGRNFGRAVVDGIQAEINNRCKTERDFTEFAKKNPRLTLWLHGTGAQDLGFSLPEVALGLSREDLREKVKDARVLAEQDREKRITLLTKRGLPALARTYHRKETPEEMKEAIKTIFARQNKTIPAEAEVKRVIGKLEKEYDSLRGSRDPADRKRRAKILLDEIKEITKLL